MDLQSRPDAYRKIAGIYDPIIGRVNAGLRGIAVRMHPPREGMKVLDVGCGTGMQLVAYQAAGCHVAGIDASPSMLGVAGRRLGEAARLDLGDAADMPYSDGSFDLVLATTVLHEMGPGARRAVLGEMLRVLEPEGRILLVDFEPGPLRFPRGWVARAFIEVAEAAAGTEHHRNSRAFLRRGGLPAALEGLTCSVERRKIVAGGTIGLYLVASTATSPGAP